MALKITALNNGPFMVEGDLADLQVADASGAPYDLSGKSKVYLCRCGAAATKPFCDGTHAKLAEAAKA
jgi:3-phenylpropionate/trans-cinnamate dioxygenase ferredoxin subunit